MQTTPIARVPAASLSVAAFEERFARPEVPVVLTGAVAAWPALADWSHAWFAARYPELPVSLSRNPRHVARVGRTTLGRYVAALADGRAGDLYMDQCPLEDFPGLAADLPRPAYCPADRTVFPSLWLGPAGTVVGFHKDNRNAFDRLHNLFLQVCGRKRVVLVSPDQDACMYPYPPGLGEPWHSQIDLAAPDFARFPRFADVRAVATVVEPGDALFIPGDTWHDVRALDASISVSFWWRPARVADLFLGAEGRMLPPGYAGAPAYPGAIGEADVAAFGGADRLLAALDLVALGPEGAAESARALALLDHGALRAVAAARLDF